MAGYDPQRTHHRPRPSNGSSAPVDAILDGAADEDAAEGDDAAPTAAEAEPTVTTRAEPLVEPEARPETDEPADTPVVQAPTPSAIDLSAVPPPPSGPSPARLVIGGGLVAFVLALLWWRLRSRSSSED